MSIRGALLVARLKVLDARRDRRAFLTSLLLPLVMIVALGALGYIGSRESRRSNEQSVRVAVPTAIEGADRLLAGLEPDGIRILRSDQPAVLVVRERADLALTLPAGADATLLRGEALQVRVLAGARGRSAVAVATTEAALRRIALDLSGRPVDVRIDADRLEKEPKAAASALARTVPLLALVVALPFLGSGVRALSGTRADRSIEHLLPLPLSRSSLLLGLAIGTIGAEAVQQVLLLGLLVVGSPFLVLGGAVAWTGPLVLLTGLVAAGLAAGAIGVLLGTLAASERIVNLMFGLTSAVLFATATTLQLLDRVPSGPSVTAIPILGAVLASRAAFTEDGLSGASLAALLAGTAATVAVTIRLAARRLSDGGGLRL